LYQYRLALPGFPNMGAHEDQESPATPDY